MPLSPRDRNPDRDLQRTDREFQTIAGKTGLSTMSPGGWPHYCQALLTASVRAAAQQFPGRGRQASERVHGVRKTLKEARAIARLFLPCLGEPARVTIAALAVARRRVGRARDLDVSRAVFGALSRRPRSLGL